jgi:hypothetical protein
MVAAGVLMLLVSALEALRELVFIMMGLRWGFSLWILIAFFPAPLLILFVIEGCTLLRTPRRTRLRREARLKEYLTADPPDGQPLVEIPRSSDMAYLSLWFGAVSLTSILISDSFLVFAATTVFAPAAMATGAIAVSQGHRKGLIGLGLGVTGLVVYCGLAAVMWLYLIPRLIRL